MTDFADSIFQREHITGSLGERIDISRRIVQKYIKTLKETGEKKPGKETGRIERVLRKTLRTLESKLRNRKRRTPRDKGARLGAQESPKHQGAAKTVLWKMEWDSAPDLVNKRFTRSSPKLPKHRQSTKAPKNGALENRMTFRSRPCK
ncbi:helix-turn-helix domain-containing protein [Succinimonas sp.]|uniref:helix-turn-helix domain-containing protein n=1 Tax=Succinimonas sp. TaxID=1936151 RepID=UPI0038677E3C